jgi:CheY-like chemotaxis protein
MGQLTIMAVDDDQDDLDIFKEALLTVGQNINLIIAYNGQDAIEQLSKSLHKPDIIFMDYNMPLMNGKQCLAVIKSTAFLKHIPVVIHSTNLLEDDLNYCQRLGARIFPKQIIFSKMTSELASILADVRNTVSVL